MSFEIILFCLFITFVLGPISRFFVLLGITIMVLGFTWSMFSAYNIDNMGWIFVGIFVSGFGGGAILFWPEYKRFFSS